MRILGRALMVHVMASLPSCWAPALPPQNADAASYFIAGRERILRAAENTQAVRLEAVADQAARDFNCPAANLRSAERVVRDGMGGSSSPQLGVYTVEGCGSHGVYLRVARRGITATSGFDGLWVDVTRFVLVSSDDPARGLDEIALVPHRDEGVEGTWSTGYSNRDGAAAIMEVYRALNRQGARDLSCPRGEVVVELRRTHRQMTPIAEGCGRRAVYLEGYEGLRFDLASIVPISSP